MSDHQMECACVTLIVLALSALLAYMMRLASSADPFEGPRADREPRPATRTRGAPRDGGGE
ncbi:hypothetical protein HLV35_07455 [Eggerthellaceae bacterium zg-997]|nr:hypothetical protein [Eggerthellaceae bacterium zg-997]